MADEARAIVPRLRRHPSLALWCGGNELRRAGRGATTCRSTTRIRCSVRCATSCASSTRGARWLPTSPSGPRFLNRLDLIEADPDGQHDVHGPWEHQGLRAHYALYDGGTALLHSEFGVEGMTNRRALEQLVDEEHRWPADRVNPVYEHLGAWWNNAPLVQECFGGRIDGCRDDAPRVAVAAVRRASATRSRRTCAAPRSVGVLPWQFNESFPNAWCTSRRRLARRAEACVLGRRARLPRRQPSAQFATCAWGGERRDARAHPRRRRRRGWSTSTARVVAEGDEEIARARRRARATSSCSISTGETATS